MRENFRVKKPGKLRVLGKDVLTLARIFILNNHVRKRNQFRPFCTRVDIHDGACGGIFSCMLSQSGACAVCCGLGICLHTLSGGKLLSIQMPASLQNAEHTCYAGSLYMLHDTRDKNKLFPVKYSINRFYCNLNHIHIRFFAARESETSLPPVFLE